MIAEVVAAIQGITPTRKPITEDSAIWHDLRIGGDDAWELVEWVAKRYEVSFHDFKFSDYFPGETEWGLSWWLARKFGHPETKKRRLTVGHLFAVIDRACWFDAGNSN